MDTGRHPVILRHKSCNVAVKYVFPAGQKLGWHHHPVMNYGVTCHQSSVSCDAKRNDPNASKEPFPYAKITFCVTL